MATASIGRTVKLDNKMADKVISAAKKPYVKVKVEEGLIDTKVDSKLINKLRNA